MGSWDALMGLENAAQPGKAIPERAARRPPSKSRNRPTDGSLISRENSFRNSMVEVLECAMDLAEDRCDHISRLKEEIAQGRYKVDSSELAERLLDIAHRDFR